MTTQGSLAHGLFHLSTVLFYSRSNALISVGVCLPLFEHLGGSESRTKVVTAFLHLEHTHRVAFFMVGCLPTVSPKELVTKIQVLLGDFLHGRDHVVQILNGVSQTVCHVLPLVTLQPECIHSG